MKRLLTSALAAAAVTAGMGGVAHAQDSMMGRRASQFDLGIYAGGAYTTDWFEATRGTGNEMEGYRPGFSGIFGGLANFWLSPSLGLRLHGAYLPQHLPQPDDLDDRGEEVVNGYLYDLNLVFRPFFMNEGTILPSVYFFLGGGGYTADIADSQFGVDDSDRVACLPSRDLQRSGVCLSNDPDYATVGQGTLGVGADFFPLGPVTLFGELAAHVYDSPAHVIENARGEDKYTVTGRGVLGLKALFGNILPPPPPPPPPPPMAPTAPVEDMREIQVCVLQNGQLTNVMGMYSTARGDTTVNGQAFSTAFPMTGEYAANATWYINNQPLTFQNRRFVKYGLPRVLGVNEVTRVGEFQGVPIFAEAGQTRPDVVYVLVRPGCEFQPYQVETKTGSVRGE